MPQITARGITPLQAMQISKPLIVQLAHLLDVPKEDFTFDVICTQTFFMAEEVDTYPFVKVGWFDRGAKLRDATAKQIDKAFKQAGVSSLEIVFIDFERDHYYTDGDHY